MNFAAKQNMFNKLPPIVKTSAQLKADNEFLQKCIAVEGTLMNKKKFDPLPNINLNENVIIENPICSGDTDISGN